MITWPITSSHLRLRLSMGENYCEWNFQTLLPCEKNDNEIINLWSSSCDNQRVPSFKKKICLTYPQTQVYLSSKFHCSNLCQIWDLAGTSILSQDQKRTNGPVKHLPSAYQAKWNSQWNQLNSLKTCFVWNLSVRTESDDRLNTSH